MTPNAIDLGSALQGEYTLEEKLSGTVFRARRRRDGRELAVRVVRPATPLLAAEFLALAESASHVRHPMLANVEAFGRTADDACYIASEFVRGQKLDEWADEIGIPPLAQVIELVRRLCIGLQAAARSGVAHDGINPRNVHVLGVAKGSGTRTPMKLLDLGVPALLFDHGGDPQAMRFMAPEQLQVWMRPEPPTAFRCSETMNVYSCGSLLYFLATGGPPHPGSAPSELLASQAAGRLAPPVRINPQISPGLNAVVLRALAIDPGERFASVAELGEALAQVAGSIPSPARSSRSPSAPSLPPLEPPEPSDGPPTFKTSRLEAERSEAEVLEAAAEAAGPAAPPEPAAVPSTLPPPAAEPDVRDSLSGVAPIGLFSSSPPLDERSGSSRPPADGPISSRPPLALFSEPPAPPASALVAAAPHVTPDAVVVAPERSSVMPADPELKPQRRRASGAWLVALPLAALASALAFFVVRGLMNPPPDPPASAAISSATIRPPPAVLPAPSPEPEPAAGAVLPQPMAAVEPTPQASAGTHAPPPSASINPHGRDHDHDHDRWHRGSHSANSHASSAEAASKDNADRADEPVLVVHGPPPAPADATEPPADASVAHAKPAPAAPPPATDASSASESPGLARSTPSVVRAPPPAPVKPSAPAPALPLRANVTITVMGMRRGSLPMGPVRRAMEKLNPQFAACYARAAQVAGHNGFGDLIVEIEIDEYGRARNTHASGGTLSQLDACVVDAASKLKLTEKTPDTGTVTATWKVSFTP